VIYFILEDCFSEYISRWRHIIRIYGSFSQMIVFLLKKCFFEIKPIDEPYL